MKLDATTVEVMKLVKATIENYQTKELVTFMREEMEKSREYELKLFQLMFSQRANSTYDSYQGTPSSRHTIWGDRVLPNLEWGFGTDPSN